jgi:hypothetical protein
MYALKQIIEKIISQRIGTGGLQMADVEPDFFEKT